MPFILYKDYSIDRGVVYYDSLEDIPEEEGKIKGPGFMFELDDDVSEKDISRILATNGIRNYNISGHGVSVRLPHIEVMPLYESGLELPGVIDSEAYVYWRYQGKWRNGAELQRMIEKAFRSGLK